MFASQFGLGIAQKQLPNSDLSNDNASPTGSNLGNANAHDARNLPIFLAGGGYKHGRFINMRKSEDTPLSNLYVRLLQDAGIEADTFGQSNTALAWDAE